ncbi:MAG: hypothetical protein LBL93_04775 [Ruminococcus sp.]|jgi:hypothetical protein|nr:hypothetical protein [Ruminococcus sp.]
MGNDEYEKKALFKYKFGGGKLFTCLCIADVLIFTAVIINRSLTAFWSDLFLAKDTDFDFHKLAEISSLSEINLMMQILVLIIFALEIVFIIQAFMGKKWFLITYNLSKTALILFVITNVIVKPMIIGSINPIDVFNLIIGITSLILMNLYFLKSKKVRKYIDNLHV